MHRGANIKHRNLYAIHGLQKFSSQTSVSSLVFTLHPWGQLHAGHPSMEVEAQSTDGEWRGLPQPWEVTLASFPFMLFLLSSPQVLIFRDLTRTYGKQCLDLP